MRRKMRGHRAYAVFNPRSELVPNTLGKTMAIAEDNMAARYCSSLGQCRFTVSGTDVIAAYRAGWFVGRVYIMPINRARTKVMWRRPRA